jgi:hypothetical protein
MPHGTPDWGLTSATAVVYPVTDVGELAARLGSPVTHDRRGDVIWWDDFEWGLAKWITGAGGTGASVALSTATARNGRASVLLTAGSTAGNFARLERYNPYPVLSMFGEEVSVALGSPIEDFQVLLYLSDGQEMTQFAIRYNDANSRLEYTDSTGAWLPFATSKSLFRDLTLFHTLKMVIDGRTRQYVRAVVDDATYSLGGLGAYVSPNLSAPNLRLQLLLHGRVGFNDRVYVDDVILTQNEVA